MPRLLALLESLPKTLLAVLACFLLAAVLLLDVVTGAEVSVSIFYILPVILAAWFGGRPMGMAFSLVSGLAWFAAYHRQNPALKGSLIPAWNALVEFATFALVGHLIWTLRREHDRHADEAATDLLTGALARRAFLQRLALEHQRALRNRQGLTLAYLDVDHFKALNDQHGHAAGDHLLKELAQGIMGGIRGTDCLGRLGGDEFALLLPDTDPEQAQAALEKIWSLATDLMAGLGTGTTLSLGAVAYGGAPPPPAQMLAEADREMYLVKVGGRGALRVRPVG